MNERYIGIKDLFGEKKPKSLNFAMETTFYKNFINRKTLAKNKRCWQTYKL